MIPAPHAAAVDATGTVYVAIQTVSQAENENGYDRPRESRRRVACARQGLFRKNSLSKQLLPHCLTGHAQCVLTVVPMTSTVRRIRGQREKRFR